MITLITGQPGAGKSLHTLWYVKALADKEGRQVYYSGIADLMIPGWIEIGPGAGDGIEGPHDWYKLPAGAIIVIDEAQRVYRVRAPASAVPPHVAALETHRHKGHDLFIITQHPKLVDPALRRLAGVHRHVMRAFGAKAAVVHEWNEVRPDPDLNRSDSISTTWRYPAEVFGWYKSAEVHTHKARVPLRVWLIVGSPLILLAIGYGIYRWISHKTGAEGVDANRVLAQAKAGAGGSSVGGAGGGVGAARSVSDYVASFQPRIPGLPHTAPAFDEVTKPVYAPYPAGCGQMGARCHCFTDQGTRLDVTQALCEAIIERGFFVSWESRRRQGGAPGPSMVPRDSASSPAGAAVGYPTQRGYRADQPKL